MADEFSTIWPAKRHTLAKHLILKSYLGAWTAILSSYLSSRGSKKSVLRIVDAFAGPGVHEGGEPGSPLLEIDTVLNHDRQLDCPVRFTFIEDDLDRFKSLQEQIEIRRPDWETTPSITSVRCLPGDCVTHISDMLDKIESSNVSLGPAFFFLDQFGYSKVPMSLIRRILTHPMCECLSFFNWSKLGRFLTDEAKWQALDRAFGGESWKAALNTPSQDRARHIQELYKAALREKGGAKYVWHFAMCDDFDQLTHWLFFCTNNECGLEEMKKAMRRADPSGAFAFSDRNSPGQYSLFSAYDDTALRKDILGAFAGKSVTVRDIRAFVLTETPACNFKSVLQTMIGQNFEFEWTPPGWKRGFRDENIVLRFRPQ